MITNNERQAFSNRFNTILDKAGIPPKGKGRQGVLAAMFDVSDKGARKWIEGEAIPSTSRLAIIANKFKATGVTVEWLITGNALFAPDSINGSTKKVLADLTEKSNIEYAPGLLALVPLVSWVQAGSWAEAIVIDGPGYYEAMLPCPVTHSEATYALTVKGDSMTSPYPNTHNYPEGTVIYVDPDRTLTNGCRVIAKLPDSNEATFKEYREDGGKRFLKPLNPQYPIQEINDSTIFCGVVIGQFKAE
jgi:SOS-response transcriptional repressor LexA